MFESLSCCCWFVTLFLLPCRWSDQHLDHWALHSDSPAGRLRDRRVGELAQLLLHRPGLPFHCGRCPGRSRVESVILNDPNDVSFFFQLNTWALLQRTMTIFVPQIFERMISLVFFAQIGLQQYCFLVFLVICSLTATYIFFIIPETKNKTFLEIQNEFRSSRKRNSGQADGVSTTLISSSMWLCTILSCGIIYIFFTITNVRQKDWVSYHQNHGWGYESKLCYSLNFRVAFV